MIDKVLEEIRRNRVRDPERWKQLEDKIQFISEDPDAVWCDVIDIVTK